MEKLNYLIDYSVFCNLVGVGGLSFSSVSTSSSAPDFVFFNFDSIRRNSNRSISWTRLWSGQNTCEYIPMLRFRFLFSSSSDVSSIGVSFSVFESEFSSLDSGALRARIILDTPYYSLTLVCLMRHHLDQICRCQHLFEYWFGQSLFFFWPVIQLFSHQIFPHPLRLRSFGLVFLEKRVRNHHWPVNQFSKILRFELLLFLWLNFE